MANITLPSDLARKISAKNITPEWPAQRNRSNWSGGDRIAILGGTEQHRFSVTFRPLVTETEIRQARAFFYALRGIVNTFDLPYLPTPQAGAATVVAGGGAAGSRTVTLASTAGLLPGMPISITLPSGHNRPFVVISVASPNVTLEPAFSEDAAIGAAVEIANPVCRVRMDDPSFSYSDDMGRASFGFDVVEAVGG